MMRQSTMRWIVIAIVAAMVATLGVGLVSGGGGDPASDAVDDDVPTTTTAGPDAPVAEGPHLQLELCNGVTCPEADDAGQQALVADLDADPRVASAELITSEQAYQLFLDEWGHDQELVDAVPADEMPAFIELDLYDPGVAGDVASTYQGHEAVAAVREADRASR